MMKFRYSRKWQYKTELAGDKWFVAYILLAVTRHKPSQVFIVGLFFFIGQTRSDPIWQFFLAGRRKKDRAGPMKKNRPSVRYK